MPSDGEWLNWYESGWVQVETLWGSVCIHSLVARLHQLQQPAVYQLSHITYIAFLFMENSVFRKLFINVHIRDFAFLLKHFLPLKQQYSFRQWRSKYWSHVLSYGNQSKESYWTGFEWKYIEATYMNHWNFTKQWTSNLLYRTQNLKWYFVISHVVLQALQDHV